MAGAVDVPRCGVPCHSEGQPGLPDSGGADRRDEPGLANGVGQRSELCLPANERRQGFRQPAQPQPRALLHDSREVAGGVFQQRAAGLQVQLLPQGLGMTLHRAPQTRAGG